MSGPWPILIAIWTLTAAVAFFVVEPLASARRAANLAPALAACSSQGGVLVEGYDGPVCVASPKVCP